MRILPVISKANFKGNYVHKNYTTLYEAEKTGRRQENTVGVYHSNDTNKIYYADPLEIVSDSIKEKADLIVYDDEPVLQDMDRQVSTMYFFPKSGMGQANYLKNLEDFRLYFYRIEMMDNDAVAENLSNVWKNIDKANSQAKVDYFKAQIEDAKYNQTTAAICKEIFEDATPLMNEKDYQYYEMEQLKKSIKTHTDDIAKVEHEISQRENIEKILQRKIALLELKEKSYAKIKEELSSIESENGNAIKTAQDSANYNREHLEENPAGNKNLTGVGSRGKYSYIANMILNNEPAEIQEKIDISNKHLEVKELLDNYRPLLADNITVLNELRDYSKNLPKIIKELQSKLDWRTSLFEKAKADLIPHFEKLKKYFNSRGIRVIK